MTTDDDIRYLIAGLRSGDADLMQLNFRLLFDSKHPLAQRFQVQWCEWLAEEFGKALRREPSIFDGGEEWTVIDDLMLIAKEATP